MPDYSNNTHKEYASKSKANTALGFGIAGTAAAVLTAGAAYMASQQSQNSSTNTDVSKEICDAKISYLQDRYEDRARIDAEIFALYERGNRDSFANYVAQRDGFDVLSKEISDLKAHIAVTDAVRPYQDKLIQCEIENAKRDANFNLLWRTRNMIEGTLMLPKSPTVTGYPSATNYCCDNGIVAE